MSFFAGVELARAAAEAIMEHGERAYPEEACGLLIGPPPEGKAGLRRIEIAEAVENEKTEERTHRFLVSPAKLRMSEEYWEGRQKSIVGIYHSHPDHPAEPSQFDLEHGWPWYTYILVGVLKGKSGPPAAFEIDSERTSWQPRPLHTLSAPTYGENKP